MNLKKILSVFFVCGFCSMFLIAQSPSLEMNQCCPCGCSKERK